MAQPLLGHPFMRLGQHLFGKVDACHLHMRGIEWQGQASANPDFQHRAADMVGKARRAPPSSMGDRAKGAIINRGPAGIGFRDGFKLHPGLLSDHQVSVGPASGVLSRRTMLKPTMPT